MGLLGNFLKAWKVARKEQAQTKRKVKLLPEQQEAKDLATLRNEPWVSVVRVEVDPDTLEDGLFELDWNDIFIARLIKRGYPGKTDKDKVDAWFQQICGNVYAQNYEQEIADPEKRRYIQRQQRGDGRSEIG